MVGIFKKLLPSFIWRVPTKEKILFLTFDDGPVPEATPETLGLLSAHKAQATFFCIGENIQKYPEIFERILQEGHMAGNHTWNHINGWHSSKENYIASVVRCETVLNEKKPSSASRLLFRPPYGKLKFSQYAALRHRYRIVLWDVLPRDWEQNRTFESCFDRIARKASPGSIVVFHDSIKARDRMLPALEKTLIHFSGLGYRFESLEKYV